MNNEEHPDFEAYLIRRHIHYLEDNNYLPSINNLIAIKDSKDCYCCKREDII